MGRRILTGIPQALDASPKNKKNGRLSLHSHKEAIPTEFSTNLHI
jgi:hypothetical protein